MTKILVIFHLYYLDQLDWFLGKLSHLHGCEWDLLVTGPDLGPSTRKAIEALKPKAMFLVTENAGYDIWPFLNALQHINPDDYDWILKLHTKSKIEKRKTQHLNGLHLKDYQWRDLLVNALLESDGQFDKVLDLVGRKEDAGMICAHKLYFTYHAPEDHALLDEELARIHLSTPERRFCLGTMMVLKASLLKALPLDTYKASDFPAPNISHSRGTLAHVYERILSLLAPAQGYKVYTLGGDPAFERMQKRRRITKPILDFIFSIDRRGEQEKKYLTIMGLRIKLEK